MWFKRLRVTGDSEARYELRSAVDDIDDIEEIKPVSPYEDEYILGSDDVEDEIYTLGSNLGCNVTRK